MDEPDDPILLTRRPDARTYVLALLMPFLALVFVGGSIAGVQGLIVPGRRPNSAWDYGFTALAIVLAAGFVWGTFHFVRGALTKAVFRTQSAELVTFGRVRRSVPYRACSRFVYQRQRNYNYGVWVGTCFRIRLSAPGVRSVSLSGRHKERATLVGSSIFSKEFTGGDEIDVLPGHIGSIMAEEWEKRLNAGEQIRWSWYVLTRDGIVPRLGPHGGECIAYDRLTLSARSMEVFDVLIDGERDIGRIRSGEVNFWPGAIVIERRASQVWREETE